MTRPSERDANVIKSRARFGYNEEQLARHIGVTRETMRGWAKTNRYFAMALDEALQISRNYWLDVGEQCRRREMNEFPKRFWAEAKAERKAELDAMSADEIHEQAKARRREIAKQKRDAISVEGLRAAKRKAPKISGRELELDDAAWDRASN
jgi:DNA-binding XRE family transcriptional regulator